MVADRPCVTDRVTNTGQFADSFQASPKPGQSLEAVRKTNEPILAMLHSGPPTESALGGVGLTNSASPLNFASYGVTMV